MLMIAFAGLAAALHGTPAPYAYSPAGEPPRVEAARVAGDLLVSAAWLAEHAGDADVVIVHVAHERAEYDRGHVPGARFLPYESIAGEVDGLAVELRSPRELEEAFEAAGVSDGSRIVLYGHPMSAARAWATLDYLGHGDHAAVLDGGLEAWRAEGRPVSREAARPRRGALTPRAQPERFVDAEWVRAHLGARGVALVDARPAEEFSGSDGGHGGMHGAGHIPGARNLYWEELLVSRADPRFRSREELAARFRQAGAEPGETVVAYCMIGMRASVAYFVARYLGYQTRFYDGSWQDWSSRRLPVEGGTP
ncbi:MAG TPA: sulfurtransferase [Longimicrobiaceae bacterium]|nr:sulfurtransferase [Longimicrobiaceae bacterium]